MKEKTELVSSAAFSSTNSPGAKDKKQSNEGQGQSMPELSVEPIAEADEEDETSQVTPSEADDNISLSEDSVYLRMTEHGTPRVVEEVYRNYAAAGYEADAMSVNKEFFTGHSRTTNNEIYFNRDLTTPALYGAINVQAQLASKGVDIRARQTICSKLGKPGASEAPPENDEERITAEKERVRNLRATHDLVRAETLRKSHEEGYGKEQKLPPRPKEALLMVEGITPSTIDQLAKPRPFSANPATDRSRSAKGADARRVYPHPPSAIRPSSNSKRPASAGPARAASFSKLGMHPALPTHKPKQEQEELSQKQKQLTAAINRTRSTQGQKKQDPEPLSPKAIALNRMKSSPKPMHFGATTTTTTTTSSNDSSYIRDSLRNQSPPTSPIKSYTQISPDKDHNASNGSIVVGACSPKSRKSTRLLRNSIYIKSVIHGRAKSNIQDDDTSSDSSGDSDWDEDGKICGNFPRDTTLAGRLMHAQRRRGILGPRVHSALENDQRAAGTWEDHRNRKKEPRRITFRQAREDAEGPAVTVVDNDAASATSVSDVESEDEATPEELAQEQTRATMLARMKIREAYLKHKAEIEDIENMKPFVWLNTADAKLDSEKLGLSGKTGLSGQKIMNVKINLPSNNSNVSKSEDEKHVEQEEPLMIRHGRFYKCERVTHDILSEKNVERNRSKGIRQPRILQNKQPVLSSKGEKFDTDANSVVEKADTPGEKHAPIVIYDEFYDMQYFHVLETLLLHSDKHVVDSVHTKIDRLDGPHSLHSPKQSGGSSKSRRGSPSSPNSSTNANSSSCAKKMNLWHRVIEMEKERLKFLDENINNDNQRANSVCEGHSHHSFTKNTTKSNKDKAFNSRAEVLTRSEMHHVSEVATQKAKKILANLSCNADNDVKNSTTPNFMSSTEKKKAPQLQPQALLPRERPKWNKFSFVNNELAALSNLNITQLMEVLVRNQAAAASSSTSGNGIHHGDHENNENNNSNMSNSNSAVKTRPSPSMLSAELAQLFKGFIVLDSDGDGLLSSENIVEFMSDYPPALTTLTESMVSEMIYAQDDSSRGSLTFDEIKTLYMRLRPLLNEQLDIWQKKESNNTKFQTNMKNKKSITTTITKTPAASGHKASPSSVLDIEAAAVEDVKLPFMPLMLYRLLLFVSFIDEEGKVLLMRVYQSFAEQFGTKHAEAAYQLLFLHKSTSIKNEESYLTLNEFIKYVQCNSVESKYKPTIFAVPTIRQSIPSVEQRQKCGKNKGKGF